MSVKAAQAVLRQDADRHPAMQREPGHDREPERIEVWQRGTRQ